MSPYTPVMIWCGVFNGGGSWVYKVLGWYWSTTAHVQALVPLGWYGAAWGGYGPSLIGMPPPVLSTYSCVMILVVFGIGGVMLVWGSGKISWYIYGISAITLSSRIIWVSFIQAQSGTDMSIEIYRPPLPMLSLPSLVTCLWYMFSWFWGEGYGSMYNMCYSAFTGAASMSCAGAISMRFTGAVIICLGYLGFWPFSHCTRLQIWVLGHSVRVSTESVWFFGVWYILGGAISGVSHKCIITHASTCGCSSKTYNDAVVAAMGAINNPLRDALYKAGAWDVISEGGGIQCWVVCV